MRRYYWPESGAGHDDTGRLIHSEYMHGLFCLASRELPPLHYFSDQQPGQMQNFREATGHRYAKQKGARAEKLGVSMGPLPRIRRARATAFPEPNHVQCLGIAPWDVGGPNLFTSSFQHSDYHINHECDYSR